MAKDREDIIDKIQKLFALAGNNPSEDEAANAALLAQRLIAKHGIEKSELENRAKEEEGEDIGHFEFYTGPGKAWKFRLAHIISENFRCKRYWLGRSFVAFYGYETDAKAALEVYKYVFNAGHKLATHEVNYRHNRGYSAEGVYNSFILGFMKGLKEKLDAQCKALMIIIAPEVTESYDEMVKDWNKLKNTAPRTKGNKLDVNAFAKGLDEGRNIMGKREIKA